jgi:hypothetical protein
MEFERIYAYHEICQWCGEPCFADAEVSLDVYLLQIPKRDRRYVIMDLIRALWMVNLLLLGKEKPDIENTRDLNLAVVRHMTV